LGKDVVQDTASHLFSQRIHKDTAPNPQLTVSIRRTAQLATPVPKLLLAISRIRLFFGA
jgi:hypothetical protein